MMHLVYGLVGEAERAETERASAEQAQADAERARAEQARAAAHAEAERKSAALARSWHTVLEADRVRTEQVRAWQAQRDAEYARAAQASAERVEAERIRAVLVRADRAKAAARLAAERAHAEDAREREAAETHRISHVAAMRAARAGGDLGLSAQARVEGAYLLGLWAAYPSRALPSYEQVAGAFGFMPQAMVPIAWEISQRGYLDPITNNEHAAYVSQHGY